MSITVTAEFEAKIREKVESGRYDSAEAVIGEALRLLDEHEKRLRLKAMLDEGFKGPFSPLTPEESAASWERAKQRARAGERPSPDVIPYDDPR